MKGVLFFLFLILSLRGSGAEFGDVVSRLKEPTVAQAKQVLADLDQMIATGNARTVTLGKKMRRSIRRIFTSEYKMSEARKKAEAGEERAKQLDLNGRKWLQPNVHGRINKIAAQAAFEEARTIRKKSQWTREELSREWRKEVTDFEKMLGDLEFSKEEEALFTLAILLEKIVARTEWVERPRLQYGGQRLAFLKNRIAGRDRWLLLAGHASDAKNYELSYDFYRKAGNDLGKSRVGAQLAGGLAEAGYPGSAINIWERLGELDQARALLAQNPDPAAADYRVLSPAALERNVAPACVRVLTVGGHQSACFVKPGGYLATCRVGLRNDEGEAAPLAVLLEDGRVLDAVIVRESRSADLALLKIDLAKHELLPLGKSDEAKAGETVTLFGFDEVKENTPDSNAVTVLTASEQWRDQPVMRLAVDGSRGQRGAPLVDARGRMMGMFLTSKTGSAYALQARALRDLLSRVD